MWRVWIEIKAKPKLYTTKYLSPSVWRVWIEMVRDKARKFKT